MGIDFFLCCTSVILCLYIYMYSFVLFCFDLDFLNFVCTLVIIGPYNKDLGYIFIQRYQCSAFYVSNETHDSYLYKDALILIFTDPQQSSLQAQKMTISLSPH
jgi:hypothetical protein